MYYYSAVLRLEENEGGKEFPVGCHFLKENDLDAKAQVDDFRDSFEAIGVILVSDKLEEVIEVGTGYATVRTIDFPTSTATDTEAGTQGNAIDIK